MAKPELRDHRKFLRLKRILSEPVPHLIGYLECLWIRGYQTGSAFIGDTMDVEGAAEYPGEPGKLTNALHSCGFIDQDSSDGNYSIHDLYEHAPRYVKRRMGRKGNGPEGDDIDGDDDDEDEPIGTNTRPRGSRNPKPRPTRAATVTPLPENATEVRPPQEPRTESLNQEPKAENQEPPQKGGEAASSPDVVLPPIEFQRAWNEAAKANGWRSCERMTADREKSFRARLRDPHWRSNWREALIRAGPIPAFRGLGTERNWKADIDFFLKPHTVAKLLEGSYDDWGKDNENSNNRGTKGSNRTAGRILPGDANDGQSAPGETSKGAADQVSAGTSPEHGVDRSEDSESDSGASGVF